MRLQFLAPFAAAVLLLAASIAGRAEDTKPQAGPDAAFAGRLFAGAVSPDKNYACFVRRYDSAHLAPHPLQKVSAMKLLVSTDKSEESAAFNYSFRMAVNFVKRAGNFDSSGDCMRPQGEMTGDSKMAFNCAVDCDGGGIEIEFNKDNKITLVRLDRIRIWKNNQPEDEGLDLSGGADDKVFRLDRAKLDLCRLLITDRKELVAVKTLKNRSSQCTVAMY
jgi:hypothetical protein